ncbi:MAG TPA: dihydrodipicolinate synthase family protein, partial [Syntrophomonas sp.]|nr:dihydrodipicolinate synthase family protein [Syntrophomonas sp.]
ISTGCRGAVGSTYNYAAPLYLSLIDSFNNGDLHFARQLQHISIKMISLLGKYGGMATGKAFMKYAGLDCGKSRCPVKNMTDEDYMRFLQDVRALKMDNYFSKMPE